MSPRRVADPTRKATAELRRVTAGFGIRVRDARVARRWTVAHVAERAGISPDMVYRIEAGTPVSLQTASRIAAALERRLEIELVDPRRRRSSLSADIVHSAMGEFEAAHLRKLGFRVGIDEPYQHFQFAGRADVVAWDPSRRALLHLENRTRFPDFQEMAGAFNAKRAYLGDAIAARAGVRGWASQTHAIVALWTAEVVHALRLRAASFEALCPDDRQMIDQWWAGDPPATGVTSSFVVVDLLARRRQEPFAGLDRALGTRPRHRGYAEVTALLRAA